MRLAYAHANATTDTLTLALMVLNDQPAEADIRLGRRTPVPIAMRRPSVMPATTDFVRARLFDKPRSEA